MGSPNVFWGSRNDLAALCNNILGFDMLYSLSDMVFSTSGWIMKTNIVSASSLIIQDETEFRPIISCQNVWGVAKLGKWIFMGSPDKKFENHCSKSSKGVSGLHDMTHTKMMEMGGQRLEVMRSERGHDDPSERPKTKVRVYRRYAS